MRRSLRVSIFSFCFAIIGGHAQAVDDGPYDLKITSIQAFLVDRASGTLSKDIVGGGAKIFVSSGSINDTKTKSADDVLVSVHFHRTFNQAFQPNITIFALAHLKNGVEPFDEFIHVVSWQREGELFSDGSKGDDASATMLLKGVTCDNLDVGAVVEGGNLTSGDRAVIILPFVCKE
jgi:hypothetical protein